ASGNGKRTGNSLPKQFIKINGHTLLEYTVSKFEKNKNTDRIILLFNKEYVEFCSKFNFKKLYKIVSGGKQRQDSSRIGVSYVAENDAKILIHDGVRPFVSDNLINKCYSALDRYNAVNTGIETGDTIIQINAERIIVNVPERKTLLRCQTPQGFRANLIKKAHALAQNTGFSATDDAGLVKEFNLDKIFVLEGEIENIKITYPDDILKAEKLLNECAEKF
ncbi:MAG: 2-C-methyl-D-erythritol 4-phosphate cytidylyltransferase, partial [Candidatus Gastranaerophilales bacterium]|nr:2-C-methyl-D-erythritol 4-phosphate cytidylyltransferase [Candidatus Gastranaerophilales bacterium]